MGSKSHASAVLFLALNLIFFSIVTASSCSCSNPTPPPKPKTPPSPKPTPAPSTPKSPTPKTPPAPIATPPSKATCPRDALKLGVCANLLSGLIGAVIGTTPSKTPCCSLIQGLVDVEAAVCLCTAIKANILGINLNVPVSLSLLLNACGYKVPSGFKCA